MQRTSISNLSVYSTAYSNSKFNSNMEVEETESTNDPVVGTVRTLKLFGRIVNKWHP